MSLPKKILGARILVKEDEVVDSVTARAKAVGLSIVIDESNRPRSTTGTIVMLGTDPMLIQEWKLQIGDRVSFGRLSGSYEFYSGEKFRMLEYQEITAVLNPDTPLA